MIGTHGPCIGRTRAAARAAMLLGTMLASAGPDAASERPEPVVRREEPLKVFVLAGQSNMQGHAHVRTLGAMRHDPTTARLLELICEPDGRPRVSERVWISSLGSADTERTGRLTAGFGAEGGGPKFGPELTFGITMERLLDEPVLIIKTAWGGRSLHTDYRPPSAGAVELNAGQVESLEQRGEDVAAARAAAREDSGRSYRLMVGHVRAVLADIGRVVPGYDPDQGYALAGFVWFQGWNDMVDGGAYPDRGKPGGFDAYSALLAQFIRDVRADFAATEMPFIIGVMGVGGPIERYGPERAREASVHGSFRAAMAAPAELPELRGTVAVVRTEEFWDLELVALRAREAELRPRLEAIGAAEREGRTSREEAEAARRRLDRECFTERELAILRESTSNQEYHYFGSARIMAPIGEAFADALYGMMPAGRRR